MSDNMYCWCGGKMICDGFNSPVQCEDLNYELGTVEPDSGPYYCETEEEASFMDQYAKEEEARLNSPEARKLKWGEAALDAWSHNRPVPPFMG